MSNLPKVVTIVALGVVAAASAGYYALTGQKGSDGQIVIATGGLPHYQELGAAYQKALEPYGVKVVLRPAAEGFSTLKGLVADTPQFDAGFVKGGLVGSMQGRLARSKAQDWQSKQLGKLRSVGRLFYEPIWVFVRADLPPRACATSRASGSSPARARAAHVASPRSCCAPTASRCRRTIRSSSRKI